MARDHYIPASVLGRFSAGLGSRVRERGLVVGRKGKVFEAKAEDIGLVNRLYDVSSARAVLPPGTEDPGSVDGMMTGYEPDLPAALDLLDGGSQVPLQPWLRILVPFASLSGLERCRESWPPPSKSATCSASMPVPRRVRMW